MSSTINAEATLTEARRPHYVFEQNLERGSKFVMEFPGEKPLWFDRVIARIIRLLDLPPNWDSYGARVVDVDSVKTALRVMFWTMKPETPLPQIIPTPKGTIQLEWHLRGIDLEVEAMPSGLLQISYEDSRSSEIVEDLTTSSLTVMTQALAKISERK
jgi:hypothetical protein